MEKENRIHESKDNVNENVNNYLVIGMIGLILVLSIVQSFQISSIKNGLSGNAVAGETYEEMTARMHPDQVARGQVQIQSNTGNAPTMVGGC
mgnify:CR=1 FL=1